MKVWRFSLSITEKKETTEKKKKNLIMAAINQLLYLLGSRNSA